MATRRYRVYKQQVSYDGGETWEDVLPLTTVKMPSYGETCTAPYAARVCGDRYLPPMDTLTKEYVSFLTGRQVYDGPSGDVIVYDNIGHGLYIGTGTTTIAGNAFTDYKGSDIDGQTVFFEEPSSVITIGTRAFFAHPYRREVKIPDSVEYIGKEAFATDDYSNLRYVEIGSGCTYIGQSAFAEISSMHGGNDKRKIIVMKGSTPPELWEDGYGVFSKNGNMLGFVIEVPDDAVSTYRSAWQRMSGNVISDADTAIGNTAKAELNYHVYPSTSQYYVSEIRSSIFQLQNDGSSALTYSEISGACPSPIMSWLKIGDSVKIIPDNAFGSYGGNFPAIKYLNLGNGVEEIGYEAFRGQTMRDLIIPGNVSTIGEKAFYGASIKNLKIESGCTSIGNSAFEECTELMNVDLPDTIEYIGNYAFSQTYRFSFEGNAKLPSSLTYIGKNAFRHVSTTYCSHRVETITIPSGVTYIGDNAFSGYKTNVFSIGNAISEIGSGQCNPIVVTIGATTPPTVMNDRYIDDETKIGWMNTSLIYVPDSAYETYKSTYGWCFLQNHMFPMSEITNIFDFAGDYKCCGLNSAQGAYISEYHTYEQGVLFRHNYGSINRERLTSADTYYNTGVSNVPPNVIWIGDDVEYVDDNSFGVLTIDLKLVVFGTGLKEFVNLKHGTPTYVFKTETPPGYSCKNSGHTSFSNMFYVPDNAVETYRNWLRHNLAKPYRATCGINSQLSTCDGYDVSDDYNVRPISEFLYGSGNSQSRTISGGTYCSGYDLYVDVFDQVSYDEGNTWITIRTTPVLVAAQSVSCGFMPPVKFYAEYSDGSTYSAACDDATTLWQSDVRAAGMDYSAMTTAIIGDCVTYIGNSAFYNCSSLKNIYVGSGLTGTSDFLFWYCENITDVSYNSPTVFKLFGSYSYPSTITAYTLGDNVTSIDDHAFYGIGVTSMIIPDGVTSIGNYAFNGCRSLTSIEIPNSVTSIGSSAFRNCTGLTSCTIGSGVTSIGEYTFQNCWGLSDIDIPDNVTAIGLYAFSQCTGLTSCTIGSGVTSIGNRAFENCTSLVKFGSNVYGLLNIPNSVTTLEQGAFYRCSGLTSCTIGSGITSIAASTFSNCSGLASIDIPSGVTSIGQEAFYRCSGLTSIVIPDSVTSIGNSAFNWCSNAATVTIGSGVTSIGGYAFYSVSTQATGSRSFTIKATVPPTLGESAFAATNSAPIYVPRGSVNAYKSASGWSDYASRIQAIQ